MPTRRKTKSAKLKDAKAPKSTSHTPRDAAKTVSGPTLPSHFTSVHFRAAIGCARQLIHLPCYSSIYLLYRPKFPLRETRAGLRSEPTIETAETEDPESILRNLRKTKTARGVEQPQSQPQTDLLTRSNLGRLNRSAHSDLVNPPFSNISYDLWPWAFGLIRAGGSMIRDLFLRLLSQPGTS